MTVPEVLAELAANGCTLGVDEYGVLLLTWPQRPAPLPGDLWDSVHSHAAELRALTLAQITNPPMIPDRERCTAHTDT